MSIPRIWLLLCLTCLPILAQASNPFAGDRKAAETGMATFRRHCSSCHGKQAEGGRAPDLTARQMSALDSDADLFNTISAGVPGTDMEAYGARLRPEEIWQIVTFLRSAVRVEPPVAGDPAHGEALFWGKGGCGNCHAVGNRGNQVGPDLSRIGRQRSVSFLRESLLDPSADIVPGYYGVTVITRDGKTIRGVERAVDDFSVLLQDFSGHIYSFERTGVRSVSRDNQSLMPEYGKLLSSAEINDVLAYLFTLGGVPK